MALPSITTSYNRSINDIGVLTSFITGSQTLASQHQYLIAEVVMLRLFGVFEATVQELAFKLACGALYRNATAPGVLHTCRTLSDAHYQMLSRGRRRPLPYLKWTKASYIEDSIKFVLDTSDSFYSRILLNGAALNEMRIVRNQIAHRTSSTKHQFDTVLITRYGANPRISMGAFLTSTSRHSQSNIDRYVREMRIILNDLTSG
jgi:hypothetical protein